MQALFRFVGSRWFLSFVGVFLLAALVWFLGPLVPGLDGILARLIIILLMLGIWGLVNFLIDRKNKKRDDALTGGIARVDIDPNASAAAEESAALKDRLSGALALLKKASGKRGYLFEQPWYAIIGPPGSGKTTALLNSGLRFPLAAEMGQGAVAGVGGTRLCDWWFTDQAVLIDTAGRYTTQDSNSAVDRAGWETFLDLLKKSRGRQPLNGVLVAIAINDIVQASGDERKLHAQAIRRRIKELRERLGVRLPIYAVLTKTDLIAGFTEFFDDFDRERRGQVWGVTFPLNASSETTSGESEPIAGFKVAFRALLDRLEARLIDRLQAERSPDRRALMVGFPAQIASLEQPLLDFLDEAFAGSRLDPPPFLRGVYLTSGTQEGTPIDRLTGALSRIFGVDQRRVAVLRPEKGRSYFIERLLRDVIFNEAMLVSHDPATRRRQRLMRLAVLIGIAVLSIGLALGLWVAGASSKHAIAEINIALDHYEQTAKTLPLDPVGEADLARIVPLLDQARALPFGIDDPAGNAGFGMGISQDAKLAAAARGTYRHALERVLLPRLIWRLEAQMRSQFNAADFLYEATRVYLMLGSAGPLDKNLVRYWMVLDWQNVYPGTSGAAIRDRLTQHLDALLANPLPAVSLDGKLVDSARTVFSRVPLATRVYYRLQQSGEAQSLAPWRPADILGSSGIALFSRQSGKPLTDAIPGFFTVEGFHKIVLPRLPQATRAVADESWVLGPRAQLDPEGRQLQTLQTDVVKLYTDDYAKTWDGLINDLTLAPMGNLTQASQTLYILGSPQSPMRDLLNAMARELTLSVPPPSIVDQAAGAAGAAGGKIVDAATKLAAGGDNAAARLQNLLGGQQPPTEAPGKVIDLRYKPLRDAVGSGPGAPIDNAVHLISDMQQQLARLAAAPAGAPPIVGTGQDPTQILLAEASRQPSPIAGFLTQIARSGTALRGGGTRQQAAAAFNGGSGPAQLCQQAVQGRYPFTPNATAEIPLADFARLFAPGGMIDGFFNTQLRPFVDQSSSIWRTHAVDGVPAPVTPADLTQFQRAAAIRDLFFAGSNQPTVRFDLTPVTLDPGAHQVTLDLGGATVAYAHGPPRPTSITWPGESGTTTARLVFDPPPAGRSGVIEASGPWALFRLFGQGSLKQSDAAERFTLSFDLGERKASYEIRAGSVQNPFAPGMLQQFRCPSIQ